MFVMDDGWTKDAFTLISEKAPATYTRMQSNDWRVYVVDDIVNDLGNVREKYGYTSYMNVAFELFQAFGVTIQMGENSFPSDTTWLNRPSIEVKATAMQVTVTDFLAAVLVHEFAHIEGANEMDAFGVSADFGNMIGSEPIARLSVQTMLATL